MKCLACLNSSSIFREHIIPQRKILHIRVLVNREPAVSVHISGQIAFAGTDIVIFPRHFLILDQMGGNPFPETGFFC